MEGMQIRAARIVALWVVVAVVASAVVTCVPDTMSMALQMPSCTGDERPCVSSGVAMDCCTHPVPSLTAAKTDLLKAPVRHASQWLASIAPVVLVPPAISVVSTESPPGLNRTLGPPIYIVISTLRI